MTPKRVWFAEALISATAAEVRRLIAQAKQWASLWDQPVALWLSDKQDAFVKGIAAEFPTGPHRSCAHHCLRELAKPVLEADSHAKVPMRKKVRGLRTIEQAILKNQRGSREDGPGTRELGSSHVFSETPEDTAAPEQESAGDVVLDSCAAVRGILNDDQGGPLHPPGVRMAEALEEVQESIQRNLDAKKGGSAEKQLSRLADCIDRGLDAVAEEQAVIREHVEEMCEVAATLDPAGGIGRIARRSSEP